MIADVLLNEEAVILLIDEIENAGIDKLKAINLLNAQGKLVLIITHQPSLALMGEYRLFMQEGGIKGCIQRTEEEYLLLQKLQFMEQGMEQFTQKLRKGESLSESLLEQYLPHFTV